jgi:putative ABC transport system permease protein
MVSPDYFETFRIPVLAGRSFAAADDDHAAPVAVVGTRLAERMGGPGAAVGRRILLRPEDDPLWVTVIGVVPHVVQGSLYEPLRPTIYLPLAQQDVKFVSIALRAAGPPEAQAEPLRRAVAAVDPDLPVYWLRTMDEWIDRSLFMPRFFALMFGVFGAAGLVLAAGGLFAVLAQTVLARTGEIGLRRALGASSGEIVRLLFRRTAAQLAIGVPAGLVVAAGLGAVLQRSLYGVGPFDPATFITVAAVIVAASVAASLLPARRALAIDPADALRYE